MRTNTALLVDNEPSVCSTVKSILSGVGFHVIESDDGRHALDVLTAHPGLDLLVTDAQPPEVDGRTLAEAFLLKHPLGRTILISDHVDTAEINTESNGAWAIIPKQRLSDVFMDALRGLGVWDQHRVILVVDDEALLRDFVRRILTRAGYGVMDASDGQEALELSRTNPTIDLVVTDMMMPRMTGPELVEHIREERPKLPVLLMSGNASAKLGEYATTETVLQKPFLPEQLTDRVAELLKSTGTGTITTI